MKHRAIKASARVSGRRTARQAPMAPYEFAIATERVSADNSQPEGRRLFCALFLLVIFASLRFSDTIEVVDIWRTKSAAEGRSVDQKLPGGEVITWAAARRGIDSNGSRINPIIRYWDKVKPKTEARRCLFPYFWPKWGSRLLPPRLDRGYSARDVYRRVKSRLP